MMELAERVVRVCREIAQCSEEPGRTTRTFLSPPMHDVHRILGDWMRSIGMAVHVDAAGNLRGVKGDPGRPHILIGSHLDTVPDAGAFDGVLGVVMGIALAETAEIEVIGFSEEEGVRFSMPFIGSRAVVGKLDATAPILAAIREFGLDPDQPPRARLSPAVAAYLEFHIEQGPVLDNANLQLGIVDAIVGQSRLSLTFTGHANHAGTTPMPLRRDALAAAAEWICAVENFARSTSDLVATTGALTVSPNAGNVVPGEVRVSLDVRHASDEFRHRSVTVLMEMGASIAAARGIELRHEVLLDQPAVAMDASLCGMLARAVNPGHRMNSGAGHDAMILAPYVPTAMLFLRSPGGISHHPDETVLVEDVAAALVAGKRFIADWEASHA